MNKPDQKIKFCTKYDALSRNSSEMRDKQFYRDKQLTWSTQQICLFQISHINQLICPKDGTNAGAPFLKDIHSGLFIY